MLNNLIAIEKKNDYQCNTINELVKKLIDEKYYELTLEQRKNKMKMLAMANTLNKKMEIVDNCSCDNINGKFIIKDEFTYILSLLICGNIVLLEKKESNYDCILVAYEKEESNTLKNELIKLKEVLKVKKNINIAVVIGPEGGFAESEIENLTNIGCKIITLGKRILRTETVALVMTSIILYELENN